MPAEPEKETVIRGKNVSCRIRCQSMSNEIWCCHVNKQADANATCSAHTHTLILCVCVCVFTVKGDNAQTSSQSPSSSLAHIENEGNEINQDSLNRRRSRENRNTAAATVIAHKRECLCVWGVCVVGVCVVGVCQLCVSAFRLCQRAPKQSWQLLST